MSRPYKLIVTDDPTTTLGDGKIRHYPTMLAAANAFVKAPDPYQQVIYDDGSEARELNDRELQLLEDVCDLLGYELGETSG
jgi:hypothetical protein